MRATPGDHYLRERLARRGGAGKNRGARGEGESTTVNNAKGKIQWRAAGGNGEMHFLLRRCSTTVSYGARELLERYMLAANSRDDPF